MRTDLNVIDRIFSGIFAILCPVFAVYMASCGEWICAAAFVACTPLCLTRLRRSTSLPVPEPTACSRCGGLERETVIESDADPIELCKSCGEIL